MVIGRLVVFVIFNLFFLSYVYLYLKFIRGEKYFIDGLFVYIKLIRSFS